MLPRVNDSGAGSGANLWKAQLRDRLTAVRREIEPVRRAAAGEAITYAVLALPEVAAARTVAAYVPHYDEPDTAELLDALAGRFVLLPVTLGSGELVWTYYLGSGSLVVGRFGIAEPSAAVPRRSLEDADVVVVPGVAFDPQGGRLGRGVGYYDRALAGARAGVPLIGLAYDECVVDEVPMEPHDRRVDIVVTPTRVLRAVAGPTGSGQN